MKKLAINGIYDDHALLSPSSAHRWLECPASVNITGEILEDESNDAAKFGNQLHTEAETILKAYLETHELKKGHEFINDYVNYVIDTYEALSLIDDVKVHLEIRLEQKDYVGKYKIFGTADCLLETSDSLVIIDFKSGYGVVNAYENVQLGIYGLLAQEIFNKPVKRLTIVQRDTIREFEPQNDFLESLHSKMLAVQSSLENQNNVEIKAGSWCQYCPLKFRCGTYAETVNPLIKQLTDPLLLDAKELSKIYDITNFLRIYADAVEKEVNRRIIDESEEIPGYKLIRGNGRRSWAQSEEETIKLLQANGYEATQITESHLLSFTQIEKINKKAKELVKQLVITKPGSLKVVSNKEPGEAISLERGDLLPAIEVNEKGDIHYE